MIPRLFAPNVQTAAFGKLGEPGDPDRIIHIANRLIGTYDDLMKWAANLRGSGVDNEKLGKLMQIEAKMSDMPIDTIRQFVNVLVSRADSLTEKLAREEEVDITLHLTIDIDPEISDEFHRLLAEYGAEI